METDWPEGLLLVQYSELEVQETRPLNLSITLTSVREKLQDYMTTYCKCHVYGFKPVDSNTTWYRILFIDKTKHQPVRPILLVHYKETEFFIMSCPQKKLEGYVEQGVINIFGAATIKQQLLTSTSLDTLGKLVTNRASLGVFGQFRYLQRDPALNPLNFGRLAGPKSTEQPNNNNDDQPIEDTSYHYPKFIYVSTKEQQRRIIPIQKEKMDQRYDNVEQVFGNYPLDGLECLDLKLQQSVEPVLLDHGIHIEIPTTIARPAKAIEPLNRPSKKDDPIDAFFRDNNKESTANDDDDDMLNENDNNNEEEEEEDDDDDDDDNNDDDDNGDEKEDPFENVGEYNPYAFTINIKYEGANVMAGLRDLALHGFMDPPYPSWMQALVASGSSQAYVTEDNLYLDVDTLQKKLKQ
ncbi:hypothetical protein BC941DRAFT_454899 [Chlamydoabsidia padenii]|nr:hypothetical protein BC941DRAFT_454899 [Chlamydoabsidia padenii]